MQEPGLDRQLEALFQEPGKAHHEAFAKTGGEDPEWPLWYADHLLDRLQKLLDVPLTKSHLVYLLIMVSNEQQARAPAADWAWYPARFFLERLHSSHD